MRSLALLALAACGPAFAPVSAVFEVVDAHPTSGKYGPTSLSLAATKKLNPSCSSDCELGAAFPDGGHGAWDAFAGGGYDGGVRWGPAHEVAVGATVASLVSASGVDEASCRDSHDVPAGGLLVVVRLDGFRCSFEYR